MAAYYNEFDGYPAQWLRNLIAAKLIADGDVDERSIKDVKADDLRKYTQCHFFAGIGGWSYALRLAGWPDERPVWSGSCPCQPFSVAGKQNGHEDERHLWPFWLGLISELKPSTIFGEQVSGAIAHGWLDDVYQGLEGKGYAVGAAILPAVSVGAPHKRDRLWFVADTSGSELRNKSGGGGSRKNWKNEALSGNNGTSLSLANTDHPGLQRRNGEKLSERPHKCTARTSSAFMADTTQQQQQHRPGNTGAQRRYEYSNGSTVDANPNRKPLGRPSISRQECDFWEFEPDVGRVANGIPARAHKLRAYGNAIVPQVAQAFIEAFMECRP